MMALTPQEELEKALAGFRNSRDLDIQKFLNKDAVTFENRRWCSTYVLIDDAVMMSQQDLRIEGYFTLSHKIIYLNDDMSNTKRKKYSNGLSKTDNRIHAVLIGQLGKYIDEDANYVSNVSAKQMLDAAFKLIEDVNERIATRVVVVECKQCLETDTKEVFEKRRKLHEIYKNYGFEAVQNRGDLTQYFKII